MKGKIIKSLDNEYYHHGEGYVDYWSSTNLKYYLKSPVEAYYQKYQAEKKDTAAFREGRLFHDMMESIIKTGDDSLFMSCHDVFEAPINPKTGEAYGVSTKAFKSSCAGLGNPCSIEELELVSNMANSILKNNPSLKTMMQMATAETSYFWEDGEIKYKVRTDMELKDSIFDWKKVKKS